MRYVEVSVDQPPAERQPMHQFVVEHPDYTVSRLLYRHQDSPTTHAALFHVEGPREPYETVLAAEHSVDAYELSPCPDETFYLYVRGSLDPDSQAFADAFAQPGLLVITPVAFRADGTVHVTAVGPAATVQAAVEAVPEGMGVEVLSVGEYLAGRVDTRLELTQRQLEAVRAAVDCGYYSEPRDGSLEDVADRLDASTGTVGELLRRAERTVMASVAKGGPF
jgi:hypothetical protein